MHVFSQEKSKSDLYIRTSKELHWKLMTIMKTTENL